MSELLGWDLMYKVSENDIKKKEDVLTLLVHYCMIKKGFRCIGLGESNDSTGAEASSELLPPGWNDSVNYTLRYTRDNIQFTLRAIPVDGNLVFNLLNMSTLSVSNVAYHVDTTVSELRGKLQSLVPDSEAVLSKINENLLDPQAQAATTSEATTQTRPNPGQIINQSGVPRPDFPSSLIVDPEARRDPLRDPFRDPLRVGRSDLDPFAPLGGGMLFTPGGQVPDRGIGIPGGLPRGAVPPGARFDPFGPSPVEPRRFPPPDSDDDLGFGRGLGGRFGRGGFGGGAGFGGGYSFI